MGNSIFSLEGRFGRKQYLLYFVIACLLVMVGGGLSGISEQLGMALYWVMALLGLAVYLLATIKRLNDLEKSKLLVLLVAVPLVNFVFFLYLLFAKGTLMKK